MESRKKPYYEGKKQTGFSHPKKSAMAAPARGSTIQCITNDFKIKSKNHGIIYTYSVDFIESGKAGAGMEGT
jgi:hypothetical protein